MAVPPAASTKLPVIAQLFPQSKEPEREYEQYHYAFEDGTWKPSLTLSSPAIAAPDVFSVMSWNIDFMRAAPDERMKAALDYLGTYEWRLRRPTMIMFNEMVASDLKLIQRESWVREAYNVTDLTGETWIHRYGTCMLIPKSMPITKVFRVPYRNSMMGRDALFVDIALLNAKTLRVCATHLESLRAHPPRRPNQLATAAAFMKKADASILGGDLNAIEDFDKTLHLDNDLKDAYLENGGEEGAAEGMTWGHMACKQERDRYGLGRLDKLFFCGALKLDPAGFRTFGMDVVVEGGAGKAITDSRYETFEKAWATDHLGIMADFRLVPDV